jgi:hypothetical protein
LLEWVIMRCLPASTELLEARRIEIYVLVVTNGLIGGLHLELILGSCIWIHAFGCLVGRVEYLMVVSFGIMDMFHASRYLAGPIR